MPMMKGGYWTQDAQGRAMFVPEDNRSSWQPNQEVLDRQEPQPIQTQTQAREQPIQSIQESVQYQSQQIPLPRQPINIPSWIQQNPSPKKFPMISPFEMKIRGISNISRPPFIPLTAGRDFSIGSFRPLTKNIFSENYFGNRMFEMENYIETTTDENGQIIEQRKRFFRPISISRI